MTKVAPNIGNKALEQDYKLLRSLIQVAPLFWFAVETQARCEEKVAEGLRERGFVTYLPMVPDLRKDKKRNRTNDLSKVMFARYVFVGMKVSGLSTALITRCKGVERILTFREDQQPHLIPAPQILAILDAVQTAQTGKKSVVGQAFAIGDGVVFVAGGSNTFNGTIRSLDRGKGTARVNLTMLGGERSVTVPLDNLDHS